MAQVNRERIPERVIHAKGAGAHGAFTVTARDPAPSMVASRRTRTKRSTNGRAPRSMSAPVGVTLWTRCCRPSSSAVPTRIATNNLAGHMKGIPERIARLQIEHFLKADPAYGQGV